MATKDELTLLTIDVIEELCEIARSEAAVEERRERVQAVLLTAQDRLTLVSTLDSTPIPLSREERVSLVALSDLRRSRIAPWGDAA